MKTSSNPITPWLLLLLLLNVTSLAVRAQYTVTGELTINSGGIQDASSTNNFEYRPNGILIDNGAGSGSLLSGDQGGGIRFFWNPASLALRAGWAYTDEFDQANLGYNSFAFGTDVRASGSGSIALGVYLNASGSPSVALGTSSAATGNYSTAIGTYCSATGLASLAMGYQCTASGDQSTAIGYGNVAWSNVSLAFGFCTTCGGPAAVTFGEYTSTGGSCAASFGYNTNSNSFASVAFGQFNVGGGTWCNFLPWDPLLELGNGTDAAHPSDAMIVYKNGNATFQGAVTVAPGGDIPMYNGS